MGKLNELLLGYEEGKKAHQMRAEGYSYRRIAEALGVNHSTVIRAVNRSEGEKTKRPISANNRESDPGRNGNPIVIEGQPKSLTAALCGDPSPERWAFIHGREAAE